MNSLLVVLPVGPHERTLALETLGWAAHLDGHLSCSALLAIDALDSELEDAARKLFDKVEVFVLNKCPFGEIWPRPQNWAWQSVARHLVSDPTFKSTWFWWEPDAIPVKKKWLQTLFALHKAGGKDFSGVLLEATQSKHTWTYMAGVGFYSPRAAHIMQNAVMCREAPFDMVGGFFDGMGRKASSLWPYLTHRRPDDTRDHFFNQTTLPQLISAETVLFHPCKNGSLMRALGDKKGAPPVVEREERVLGRMRRFHSSGDLGDTIYSLAAVKALGGGDFFLSPENKSPVPLRETMSPSRAELLRRLLLAQPYIGSVTYQDKLPEVDHDLNMSRTLLQKPDRLDLQPGFNLARCFLKHLGLPLTKDQDPWLTAPRTTDIAAVVINRTPRYHNPGFPWKRVVPHYKGRIVFVGTQDEHKAFCADFGKVPYHPTRDLLELAQVIAGSKLFIGNQSVAYAIAEGLKHPAILEDCPGQCNTLFHRLNTQPKVRVGVHGALPVIKEGGDAFDSLHIRGPVEYRTGYGQLLCEFAIRIAHKGIKVALSPYLFVRPIPDDANRLLLVKLRKSATSLAILPTDSVARELKQGDVLLTMRETTTVPGEIVESINALARHLIVPTSWCETVYHTSGVRVPISVVPLGIDTQAFAYRKREGSQPFTFGCAGRYAHAGPRKGVEQAIDTFLAAFQNRDDVRLHVKLHEDCELKIAKDPRVVVTRRFLTWPEMADWYAGIDVFLCLSKGEGFGLHPLQAMAVGRPVVAPMFSGLTEFHSQLTGWVVPHYLLPSPMGGSWCEPDCAIGLFREIASKPDVCEEKGKLASQMAQFFSWEIAVEKLLKVLKSV